MNWLFAVLQGAVVIATFAVSVWLGRQTEISFMAAFVVASIIAIALAVVLPMSGLELVVLYALLQITAHIAVFVRQRY